eukprot:scaffold236729_cov14-Tisochrysis_lutea.AAC.1
MHRLFQKGLAVHKLLYKPVSSRTISISEQARQNHNNNLFNHPDPSNINTHDSHGEASGGTDPPE